MNLCSAFFQICRVKQIGKWPMKMRRDEGPEDRRCDFLLSLDIRYLVTFEVTVVACYSVGM